MMVVDQKRNFCLERNNNYVKDYGICMQVKFLKKDGFEYRFSVNDTRKDIVNAYRRAIMLNCPVMAINKVAVYKNESVMPDEMLAHRLGLVPIYTKSVDDEEHHIYLKKKSGMVYSGDIETTGLLEVPLKHIPLVLLKENTNLELELTVSKGKGIEHVKFEPANVHFNNIAEIKQNGPINFELKDLCPKGLLEQKANKIFLKDPYDCNLCRHCENKTNMNLEVIINENDFVFGIVPFRNLDLSNIFEYSYNYLNSELESLKNEILGENTKKTTKKK